MQHLKSNRFNSLMYSYLEVQDKLENSVEDKTVYDNLKQELLILQSKLQDQVRLEICKYRENEPKFTKEIIEKLNLVDSDLQITRENSDLVAFKCCLEQAETNVKFNNFQPKNLKLLKQYFNKVYNYFNNKN